MKETRNRCIEELRLDSAIPIASVVDQETFIPDPTSEKFRVRLRIRIWTISSKENVNKKINNL